MHILHPVDKAAKLLHLNLQGLSSILGVTKGAVSQWKSRGRQVPIGHCVAIELATKGAVTRQELRPHDWHLLWPELVIQHHNPSHHIKIKKIKR